MHDKGSANHIVIEGDFYMSFNRAVTNNRFREKIYTNTFLILDNPSFVCISIPYTHLFDRKGDDAFIFSTEEIVYTEESKSMKSNIIEFTRIAANS